MVTCEELLDLIAGLGEHGPSRQIDNTEMVRFRPVEAGALYDQDSLLAKQIIGELHIVMDIESRYIDLREAIERGFRLLDRDAGDRVEPLVNKVSLSCDTAGLIYIAFNGLMAAESCLND